MARPLPLHLLLCAALLLSGCGAEGPAGSGPDLLVFAAASLTDAFADLEAAFEAANPGIDVVVSTGASSALREQILEGAPADVYASANEANMHLVVDAGEAAADPVVFARNEMMIAVPAGNPGGVTALEDFARADLLVGLCAAQVPCGDFGRQVLAAAGVVPRPDTDEPTVRALLAKIEDGELDVGLVYRTDAAASPGVEGIEIPAGWNVEAHSPIVVLAGSARPERAGDFVAFVLSEDGRRILGDRGFAAP
jgi:molybdate transport system substrate-binding protein